MTPLAADRSATSLVASLARGELSAEELLLDTLDVIEGRNPELNAIVTLCPERALEQARAADRVRSRGGPLGPLHGLPIAHKDLVDTAQLRTTYGSPLFKDHVPTEDHEIVKRLRDAGAILLGKTNTPEFGAGSQTFNPVFGATRNPYDLSKTCGGSSGGAAVSLASGMLCIADGSDMGGSLRNPASFCNVVGLRPSPGRVPKVPTELAWSPLAVLGPMARNVTDCALLFSAMAGPHPKDPLSRPEAGSRFGGDLSRDLSGLRVAWSRDLGGLPIDPRVRKALESRRLELDSLGCEVEDVEPDFSGADRVFQVLRAHEFAAGFRALPAEKLAKLKDTLIWNIEAGRALRGEEVAAAQIERTVLFARFAEFFERYDYLLAPVVQVPPFDIETEWIDEIDGVKMDTYIDWMRSCFYVSALGNPALSLPFAFTEEGLPVGLQIVGRLGDDRGVLEFAKAVEDSVGIGAGRRVGRSSK